MRAGFGANWAILLLVLGLMACSSGGPPSGDGAGSGDGDGGGDGGGGDPDPPPPPPPSALFIASEAEREYYETVFRPAVSAMGPQSVAGGQTGFGALPASGFLTYAGYMELVIGDANASANVAAPTTLTLTLSNLTISGSATGFMGVTADENLVQQVVNYDGTMAISNGAVTSGIYGNAAVTLDVDGTLDSGLNVFGVDGTLVGSLYDTGGEGLRVRGTNTGLDGSMVTTIDGNPGIIGVATISARTDAVLP